MPGAHFTNWAERSRTPNIILSNAALGQGVDGILNAVAQFRSAAEALDDCTLLDVRYTGQP